MPEPDAALPEVYVQPGESRTVQEPSMMRTLLGSCVGITFWAPRLGLAALCHPMLPHRPAKADRAGVSTGRRYVDFAIRDLARQFDASGARRGEVQVKLFGGCDVLPVAKKSLRPTVGKLNYESALRVLESEGFSVSASCLGGSCGVTILFNTRTGEVFLKRLC
jgi:chemotaxis protein CheD